MFRAYPDAVLQVPSVFLVQGERVYRWIELSLHSAYFLVTMTVETEDELTLLRHILVGTAPDVIDVINATTHGTEVTRVDLMSPGYLRGEEGYCLDKLAEIWGDRDTGGWLFKLGNGTSVVDGISMDEAANPDWELLASL